MNAKVNKKSWLGYFIVLLLVLTVNAIDVGATNQFVPGEIIDLGPQSEQASEEGNDGVKPINDMLSKKDTPLNKNIVTSLWGTAPIEFDELTGTLKVVGPGTLSSPKVDIDPIDSVAYIDTSRTIPKSDVKKIIFDTTQDAVKFPEDSANMFLLTSTIVFSENLNPEYGPIVLESQRFIGFNELVIENLERVDTSQVRDMTGFFKSLASGATGQITAPDLSNFDTSNVKNMHGMFYYTSYFSDEIDIKSFDTSNVENMSTMFTAVQVPVLFGSEYATPKVKDMSYMFHFFGNQTNGLPLSLPEEFNTSEVTNMSNMFAESKVVNLELPSLFDTRKAEKADKLFFTLSNYDRAGGEVTGLVLPENFSFPVATDVSRMFQGSAISELTFSGSEFDTRNAKSTKQMFLNTRFKELRIPSNFSVDSTTAGEATMMFTNMSNLEKISFPESFNTSGKTLSNMFTNSNNVTELGIGNDFRFENDRGQFDNLGFVEREYEAADNKKWVAKLKDDVIKDFDTSLAMQNFINSQTSTAGVYKWEEPELLWGSAPIEFDEKSKVLTVTGPGTLASVSENGEFIDNDRTIRRNIVEKIIFKDDFEGDIMLPENSSAMFKTKTNHIEESNEQMRTDYWFENLVDIEGFNKVNTSNVARMDQMFAGSIYRYDDDLFVGNISLDNMDTSNVTDMSYMFYGSAYFTTDDQILNVTNFDTSKVTNMSHMFASLPVKKFPTIEDYSLNKGFNTSNVTNMEGMFSDFGFVEYQDNEKVLLFDELPFDLEQFDTSKVTNMGGMFARASIKKLIIPNPDIFDTINVTNMSEMFSGLVLEEGFDLPEGFNTKKVQDMSGMFSHSDFEHFSLPDSFDTSNVEGMSNMFENLNNSDYQMKDEKTIDELKLPDSFVTGEIIDFQLMFASSNIRKIVAPIGFGAKNKGLEYMNITKGMFVGADNLEVLTIPGFVVIPDEFGYLFDQNKSLIEITIGNNFEFGDYYGFIKRGPEPGLGWQAKFLNGGRATFSNTDDMVSYVDKNQPGAAGTYRWGEKELEWGTAPIEFDNGTLTVKGPGTLASVSENGEFIDNDKTIRRNQVRKIIFKNDFEGDIKLPKDSSSMFKIAENRGNINKDPDITEPFLNRLKDIEGFEYLNTSEVVNMESMFEGDHENNRAWYIGRTSYEGNLNMSKMDTSNVTNMKHMFYRSNYFIKRDQRTGQYLGAMDFDIRNFNTSNVEDMSYMFANLEAPIFKPITNYNDGFNTYKVTTMESMFERFNFTNNHFNNPGDDLPFDLTKLKTSKVTNMKRMFSSVGTKKLIVPGTGSDFDVSKVTDMSYMFENISQAAEFEIKAGFNTEMVKDMSFMFHYFGPNELVLPDSFNVMNVDKMESMFDTTGLNTLVLPSGFNSKNVTNMKRMFADSGRLDDLDLGQNFDTSQVTIMERMFSGLNFGDGPPNPQVMDQLRLPKGFTTENVVNMKGMFASTGSRKLVMDKEDASGNIETTDLVNLDTTNAKDISALFSGSFFESLNLSEKFGYNNQTKTDLDATYLFANTFYLEKLWIPGFVVPEFMMENDNNPFSMMFKGSTPDPSGGIITEGLTELRIGNQFRFGPDFDFVKRPGPNDNNKFKWHAKLDRGIELSFNTTNQMIDYIMRFQPNAGGIYTWQGAPLKWGTAPIEYNEVTKELKVVGGGVLATHFAYTDGPANDRVAYVDQGKTIPKSEVKKIIFTAPKDDIKLPEDSSSMFAIDQSNKLYWSEDLESIEGLELVDTSNAVCMQNFFRGEQNSSKKMSTPNLSNFNTSKVTTMAFMFMDSPFFNDGLDLSAFDVSEVTNMQGMFNGIRGTSFTLPANFVPSKVTIMDGMFAGARLEKLHLSDNFDTGQVKDMSRMFINNKVSDFSLGNNFNTQNVTNMELMFNNFGIETENPSFILDLGEKFDTSNVTNMKEMFKASDIKGLTDRSLINFKTQSVTDMTEAFGSTKFEKLVFTEGFTVDKVNNLQVFSNNRSLNVLSLPESFKTVGKDTANMFQSTNTIKDLTIGSQFRFNSKSGFEGNGEIGKVWFATLVKDDLRKTFLNTKEMVDFVNDVNNNPAGRYVLKNEDFMTWGSVPIRFDFETGVLDTIAPGLLPTFEQSGEYINEEYGIRKNDVTRINFNQPAVGRGKVKFPQDSSGLFRSGSIRADDEAIPYPPGVAEEHFKRLTHIYGLSDTNIDTSAVTDMSYMFEGDGSSSVKATNTNLAFSTKNVTRMQGLFQYSRYFPISINLSQFNTANVTDMSHMFEGVKGIKQLELPKGFQPTSATNMSYMFNDSDFEEIILPYDFSTSRVTDMSYMFAGTTNLTKLNLWEPFETTEVTNMAHMFDGTSIRELQLPGKFSIDKVSDENLIGLFKDMLKLETLRLPDSFKTKGRNLPPIFTGSEEITQITIGPDFTFGEGEEIGYGFPDRPRDQVDEDYAWEAVLKNAKKEIFRTSKEMFDYVLVENNSVAGTYTWKELPPTSLSVPDELQFENGQVGQFITQELNRSQEDKNWAITLESGIEPTTDLNITAKFNSDLQNPEPLVNALKFRTEIPGEPPVSQGVKPNQPFTVANGTEFTKVSGQNFKYQKMWNENNGFYLELSPLDSFQTLPNTYTKDITFTLNIAD